jgi:hypothetical protein
MQDGQVRSSMRHLRHYGRLNETRADVRRGRHPVMRLCSPSEDDSVRIIGVQAMLLGNLKLMDGTSHVTDRFALIMFRRSLHDQWRVELLQNVSVPLQPHCEELQDIVRHEVHLDRATKAGELDRFALRQKAHGFTRRQNMDTSEIVVRVRRWKSIEMRATDGGEKKWVCVALHFGAHQVVVDHRPYSGPAAIRRALIRKSFAR